MKPIVLVGHKHDCPLHGAGEVVSGHTATLINGRAVACAMQGAVMLVPD
jgi:uncharacterized Zn-binding protein involved in type VI secretion